MEFIPQSVRWLVPEETSPCDIFLHFRGQYAIAIPVGESLSVATLSKLAKAGYGHVYIKQASMAAWSAWTKKRYVQPGGAKPTPAASAAKENERAHEVKNLYGNKRAELQSYLQKAITKKGNADEAFRQANETLQRVMKSSMLDWYFQQFHEPPDLLQHNGRVAFSAALFCLAQNLLNGKELDALVYSALVHELEGDPVQSMKTVASQATLTSLEKGKRPVPQEVIELIKNHDELFSGQGFPKKKKAEEIPLPARIFSLLNHFDHYRLQAPGTRRARYDKVKQLMTARKQDYDPRLFDQLWDFWDKHAESMG